MTYEIPFTGQPAVYGSAALKPVLVDPGHLAVAAQRVSGVVPVQLRKAR